MGYVKSLSNYVIKNEHKDTNDGVIYERDITTIGGLNQFAKGLIPMYDSNNFIITLNNGVSIRKDIQTSKWEKNGNGVIWNLNNLPAKGQVNNNINIDIIKQDYYELQNFAYYGSCLDLIRASLTDIVSRFPGELYYMDKINAYYENENGEVITMGNDNLYLMANPFNIDLHSVEISSDERNKTPLKYFCLNGFKNYIIIDNNVEYPINSWDFKCNGQCLNKCFLPGDQIGTISIIYNKTQKLNISAWKGNDDKIIYLMNAGNKGIHIRPKLAFYNAFFASLDSFQLILLNPISSPKYSAIFNIIDENEFGYYHYLKRFTFPLGPGGYNLGVETAEYVNYISTLSDIASYYDEHFSDNIYRSLTHESIKNFDWTSNKESDNEEMDEFLIGESKLQKLLRLCGREFDNIKYKLNMLKDVNNLTYSQTNNMNINNISKCLANDGWDTINIFPVRYNNNELYSDSEFITQPYSNSNTELINCFPNGYFNYGICNDGEMTYQKIDVIQNQHMLNDDILLTKISNFISDKSYSATEINNIFARNLRLNSRNILRSKGTIDGIEKILGLFGLKSKRWIESFKRHNNTRITDGCNDITPHYDYEITEFISFAPSIVDDYSNKKNGYLIDWYNSTKTIAYNTQNYRNGIYEHYQGLPVKYDDLFINDKSVRLLSPYFNKNKIIDGSPYYQMYGGWLKKSLQCNNNDDIVANHWSDTIKNVPSVNNINDLLALPERILRNNCVYCVRDLSGEYIIIDGKAYNVFYNYNGNRYIELTVFNNSVYIYGNTYIDKIMVSDPAGDINDANMPPEVEYDLSVYRNDENIKVYLCNCGINGKTDYKISVRDSISFDGDRLIPFIDFNKNTSKIEGFSNYFLLKKVEFNKHLLLGSDEICHDNEENICLGWNQLSVDSDEYKSLQNITNYANGNNPHSGNLLYDNGIEYINYLSNIFYYAINNKQFNMLCFPNYTWEDLKPILSDFKFDFGIDERHRTYREIPSNKIDYFGNIICNDDGLEYKYSPVVAGVGEYNIMANAKLHEILYPTYNFAQYIDKNQYKTGIIEQIVNIKRVNIRFNFDANEDNKAIIKFFDKIIVKYIEQVLPPNIILQIEYKKAA